MEFTKIEYTLNSLGWQIINDGNNTYKGCKGITMFIFSINEYKNLIVINEVIEVKKAALLTRKLEMLQDLIDTVDKYRMSIRLSLNSQPTADELNFIKALKFIICMKNINEIDYLIYFPTGKRLKVIELKRDMKELLGKYNKTFTDSGNCIYSQEIDSKFSKILDESYVSDEDIFFLYNYMVIVKQYYENENEEYQGAYNEELISINRVICIFSNFL